MQALRLRGNGEDLTIRPIFRAPNQWLDFSQLPQRGYYSGRRDALET
jgi:hypothetical protein